MNGYIDEYPGYYFTSCGRVYSFKSKKFLAQRKDKDGYLLVNLHIDGKQKTCQAHRLILRAWLGEPEGELQCNHRNEHIDDNRLSNLEWLTPKDNSNYGTRQERLKKNYNNRKDRIEGSMLFKPRRIVCLNTNEEYNSIREASRKLGIANGLICRVLKGKRKTTHGLQFKYIDDGGEE